MSKKIILIAIITVFLYGGVNNTVLATQPEPPQPICEFSGRIIDTLARWMTSTKDVNKIEGFLVDIEKVGRLISRGDVGVYPTADCNEIVGKTIKVWIADQYTDSTYTIKKYKSEDFKIGGRISGDKVLYGVEATNLVFSADVGQGQIFKDTLIENRTYTVAELKKNTYRTVRNFFTEAYVLEYAPGILGACSKETGRCDVSVNPFVEIINECKSKNVANICSGEPDMSLTLPFGNGDLEKGKKYRFRITVWNKGNTETPTNQFTLVSVTNIDGSVVVHKTTTPLITDQLVKRSFFGRIWNWFAGLFKK